MIACVPAAFDTTAEGHLEIDGCDVVDLVAEHGAPLWVISEATIRANYRRLRDAFRRVYPATTVLYATKANPEPPSSGWRCRRVRWWTPSHSGICA
jgi:diaminopimelate decarboxylase